MVWKGNELFTVEDFMLRGIDACDSPEEARVFMLEYLKETHHARANIGYIAGYYSGEEQRRIFQWFDVVHPIFGTKQMDPDELFKLAYEMGLKSSAHASAGPA